MLHIAAIGWDHPEWYRNGFYPDDLPPEWRLDFYANEFAAVAVPAADWLLADRGTLSEWRDAAVPGFRWFLLLDASVLTGSSGAEACRAAALATEVLGGSLGGLVLELDVGVSPPVGLTTCLPAGLPLAVAGGSERLSLGVRDWGWCAPAGDGIPRCGGGPLRAFRCPFGADDPRGLRRTVEALSAPGGAEAVLLFDGLERDIESMRAAQVIRDLSGLG